MRRAGILRGVVAAVCAVAWLIPTPGCGRKGPAEIDGETLDEEAAQRAIEEGEQLERDLMNAEQQHTDRDSRE